MGRQDTFIVKIILLQEKNTRQTVLAKPRLHRHYANLFIWQITSKGQWTGQFFSICWFCLFEQVHTVLLRSQSCSNKSTVVMVHCQSGFNTFTLKYHSIYMKHNWVFYGLIFFAHPIKGKCSSQSFCLDCNRYQVQNFKKMANEAGFTSHTQN